MGIKNMLPGKKTVVGFILGFVSGGLTGFVVGKHSQHENTEKQLEQIEEAEYEE